MKQFNAIIGKEAGRQGQTDSITVAIASTTEKDIALFLGKEEVPMPTNPGFEFTRKQLYDEIWEISVAGVSRKYEIPYNQLLRQIKAAGIPTPPSGYWSQINHGKNPIKPELPGAATDVLLINLSPSHSSTGEKSLDFAMVELTEDNASSSGVNAVSFEDYEEKKALSSEQMVEPETYTTYGKTYNIYDRETLYREIWESPVTEVAKKYQVSDVAIHKVCKALDIPKPPKGYWAKLRAGKPVTVKPLSKTNKAVQKTGVRTGRSENEGKRREPLVFLTSKDRSVVLAVASQILLPNDGDRMHPEVIAYRKAVVEWKKSQKLNDAWVWNKRNSDSMPFLVDSISEATLPRVYRIIDALIKAMEPLDCALTGDLDFVINGETVSLCFSEYKDTVPHVLTIAENLKLLEYEEDRKRNSWARKPQFRKYDHIFNGRLKVGINGKRNFRDSQSYVLEDRLGDIMLELYEASEEIKRARKAAEEAERRRLEEEVLKEERRKRYNQEVERTLALVNLAEDYDTACKVRHLLAVIEASGVPDEKASMWVEWAKAKADWFDPTIAREDESFGKREHGKDPSAKKLDYKGYWR